MRSIDTNGSGGAIAPVRILVIGGSYGGLSAALNLLDLCNGKSARFTPDAPNVAGRISVEIKVVDKRDGYYHLIGSPLALATKDFAKTAWVKYVDCPAMNVPGISWSQGSATKVDSVRKVATIADVQTGEEYEESYDYLVTSSGHNRSWPTVPQSLTRKEYLSEVFDHIDKVNNAKDGVVVIGGGAVGIEMAAEIKLVTPTQKVTLVHSRDKLLSSEPLPDEFKDRSLLVLRETGVEVILNDRVIDVSPVDTTDGSTSYRLTLKDGSHLAAGHVIWALSKNVPTSSYLPASALDPEGQVKVSPTLNFVSDVPNYKQHFALGDMAAWSGIKRCGGAMHMGYIAANNIYQQLVEEQYNTTPKFAELAEFPPMIALAVGKQAVTYDAKTGTVWGEEPMKVYFGDDLGWLQLWNYMQLGGAGTVKVQ